MKCIFVLQKEILSLRPSLKNRGYDSVAQVVEHLTFNQRVPGSSPGGVTSHF